MVVVFLVWLMLTLPTIANRKVCEEYRSDGSCERWKACKEGGEQATRDSSPVCCSRTVHIPTSTCTGALGDPCDGHNVEQECGGFKCVNGKCSTEGTDCRRNHAHCDENWECCASWCRDHKCQGSQISLQGETPEMRERPAASPEGGGWGLSPGEEPMTWDEDSLGGGSKKAKEEVADQEKVTVSEENDGGDAKPASSTESDADKDTAKEATEQEPPDKNTAAGKTEDQDKKGTTAETVSNTEEVNKESETKPEAENADQSKSTEANGQAKETEETQPATPQTQEKPTETKENETPSQTVTIEGTAETPPASAAPSKDIEKKEEEKTKEATEQQQTNKGTAVVNKEEPDKQDMEGTAAGKKQEVVSKESETTPEDSKKEKGNEPTETEAAKGEQKDSANVNINTKSLTMNVSLNPGE
ncbi:unnamed protein product [Vitrella brassicaformis CCMP3155]|uniref:SMB domain-containing protein n=2 Tax=Vitrella brassicaformis TaxID=1169539 RepID=A0A0G4H7P1_VITBC|nr:unnamed protein product [Vitrella brassicaformis CCMP3155]|eukprot:CEM39922.1 unnamed protein product [Vitrella brassicaformis CCMP3155]